MFTSAIAIPTGEKNSMGFPQVEILNCPDESLIGSTFLLNNNGYAESNKPIVVVFDPQDQFCKSVNLKAVTIMYLKETR